MKKGQAKHVWAPEQKAEMVHKHLNEHVSVRRLEKEYNANRSMISRWVKKYIAEHGFKTVVSSQRGITSLLPCMSTEAILDSDLSFVKDNSFGNSSEILVYLNLGIRKALFILPVVGQYHGAPL